MPHSSSCFTVRCSRVSAVRTEEHEIAKLSALKVQPPPPCCPPETGHAFPSAAVLMLDVCVTVYTHSVARLHEQLRVCFSPCDQLKAA
ncbi:hypothetical protein PBY51_003331 [Eleginops maclovinus]|uniref:Uncharacterized protein n=1 Tax=Eleginops maclovinus TaxID=56733 RepID=A0AAN7XBY7_ELEMC|nr:hypothetical protein PBY51_003331 [Eleginops maclovinus]